MSNDLKFNVILDGAYPYVPHASDRPSNYIDLTNKHYNPMLGQHVLEDQLETLVQLERFGFDGAVVSEQHNGPIGLHGNPMLAGAWLAARTSKINLVINGPIMNRYSSPVRLAEEIAVLDTMSHGRLVLGLPMGHGMQYHSMGDVSPAIARARYREAHDLLRKALTEEGPFEWRGEFYNIPYVNLWPKPLHMPKSSSQGRVGGDA